MNWTKLKHLFAVWGWALFALAGVALAAAGLTIVHYSGEGWKDPVAGLFFAFAQAILAAGMVAGVLRATQSIGFFKDELRAVIEAPESTRFIREQIRTFVAEPEIRSYAADRLRDVIYSENLADSAIDARAAWRSLTGGLFRQRFSTLTGDTLNDLEFDGLIGNADYFYESHLRRITIDWVDEQRTTICIGEQVDAILRTAALETDIAFVNRYSPESDNSERQLIDYRFTEGFERVVTRADCTLLADGSEVYSVDLPPGRRMRLRRNTRKNQSIELDPFINFRSTCLWSRPEIVVECIAPDLRVYFRSMGTKPFAMRFGGDIDGRHRNLHADCDALCLPQQGYMLVVVRVSR